MYVNEEQLSEKQLLSAEEIETLLIKYQKNKTNEEVLYQINIQQRLINNYIVSKGYEYASDLGLWVLKSKIADSYKVDLDIAIDIAESIKIKSKDDMGYDSQDPSNFKKYISVGTGMVEINDDYSNLLSTIYRLQENLGYTDYSYNKNRNNLLENSINDMGKVMKKEYSLKVK